MKITVIRNSICMRRIYKPGQYDLPNEVARALIDAGHAVETRGRVVEEARTDPVPEAPSAEGESVPEETQVAAKKRPSRKSGKDRETK